MQAGRIIFDMSDLVWFFLAHENPTGIQRTQIDVFQRMRVSGADVVPVFFSRVYNSYCRLDPDRLFAGDRRYLSRLDGRVGRPLVRLRLAIRLYKSRIALQPQDRVFVAGAGWGNPRRMKMLSAASRRGIPVTWMCYDLIPIRHPEFSGRPRREYADYKGWLDQALRDGGRFICISRFVADDLSAYAADLGLTVNAKVVRLAHEFRTTDTEDSLGIVANPSVQPFARERFVLYVGAVTLRKNQFALARVWEKMLRQSGQDIPALVLVGPSWGMERFFRYLSANGFLGGKLVHFAEATDEELAFLYRHCAFTVYPSLYEGWGLPVGESLWMGKPCLASSLTAVPEVGGDHVVYFDPRDEEDMATKLRAAFRGEFAALPPSRHELRRWDEVCRDLVAAIESPGESEADQDAWRNRV